MVDVSRLAVELARHGCILVGEFRLSSGLTSPYYIDLRAVPSHPELFDMVTDAYVDEIRESGERYDRISGIATAGVPIASLVAYKLGVPFLYVRKEERTHGTGSLVEGVLERGDVVLLLDDVATTGGSIVRAVSALRERGATVGSVLVMVDREQGAGDALSKIGVKLHSITTASKLVEELHLKGMVSKEDYERVMRYIRGEGDVQGT
ncbi:MAG: orotate phosphoribosyltransferase [Candidatus Hadarchaeales archaeon]